MTNTKSTKRALLASVMAMLLCFTMLLGTTFAWFTDSVTSGSNVITAGNLDIEVQYTLGDKDDSGEFIWKDLDDATNLFQKGLWEPGHTEVVALRITNNGSLALKYAANMNIHSENVGKTNDNTDIVLSDILTVDSIIMDTGAMGDVMLEVAFSAESTLQYTNTASFKDANVLGSDVMLLPDASSYLIVKVDMADSVANEANHNGTDIPTINFGVNVLATQFTYENDSFGKDYDKDATISDATSFIGAVEGGDIVLNNDVSYYNTDPNKQMILEATNEINFDGNGNTITTLGADPSIGNHGYVAFVPPAGEDVTVSDLTVTGTGFVEVGHWGIGGGDYTVNNLTVKDLESTLANDDKGFTLACGFCHYGNAVLNDCVMTGTTNMIEGAMAVDLGCVNDTTTVINGGDYGTIYCWSHSVVTVDGAEVDSLYVAPIKGTVTVEAGTHVETLNVAYGTLDANVTKARLEKLVIEDGAIVDAIIFRDTTYTVAEWTAFVASIN